MSFSRTAQPDHPLPAPGRPIRLYRARLRLHQPWRRLGLGFLALAAVGLPLLLAAWRFTTGYIFLDVQTAFNWSRLWLLLAFLAATDSAALIGYLWLQSRQFVAIHARGLRIRTAFQAQCFLPWEQIFGIASVIIQERFLHTPLETHYRVTLFLEGNRTLRLPENLHEMSDLIQRLKAELYRRLEPEMRQKLSAGASLPFGPIRLEAQGLRLPASNLSLLPWAQIRKMEIERGYFLVWLQNGQRWRRALGEIPNPEILIELGNSYFSVKDGKPCQ